MPEGFNSRAQVPVFNDVVTNIRVEATRSSMSVSPVCINKDGCSRVRAFCSEGLDATRCRQALLYATAPKLKEARTRMKLRGALRHPGAHV
jgi:hypothetical protein